MAQLRRHGVLLVALVLLVAGAALWWRAHEVGHPAALDNQALIDASATAEVREEVSRALTAVLSFDHAAPEAARLAADTYLIDRARDEYDVLMQSLLEEAPDQELVLSAEVQDAGVQELGDTRAILIVFVDQRSQRAGDKEMTVSAAQLDVTARKVGGAWRISDFKVL